MSESIRAVEARHASLPAGGGARLPSAVYLLLRISRRMLVVTALVIAWLFVTSNELVDPIFVPTPADLWDAFQGMKAELPAAIRASVSMTLLGFALGAVIGGFLGLGMAYSLWMRELLGPLFDFLRPVPVFALIPLFILWFGVGNGPQIALIALGTSVILGVTALEAVRNVPLIYFRAAVTLGARKRTIYRTVVVPSIIPQMVAAVRVAAALSWGLNVAAEFMGSQVGLGYLIVVQEQYLRPAGIIVLVLIYSVIAYLVDWLIRLAERRITRWTERGGGAARAGLRDAIGI
jgi:ABC-type nitrate/sulfonate/bicarbonate transport system permease component